jgi:P27 family predicted phage terminase small subunit
MGKRGPAPKSTALKKIEGNLGQYPINEHEPQPEPVVEVTNAPSDLSKSGQIMYVLLTDILIRMKVFTEADEMLVKRYADTWSRWERAAKWLREHGEKYQDYARITEIVTEKKKKVRKYKLVPTGWSTYPEVAVYQQCSAMLTKYEQELGLTPASRSRISTLAGLVGNGAKTLEEAKNDNPFNYN